MWTWTEPSLVVRLPSNKVPAIFITFFVSAMRPRRFVASMKGVFMKRFILLALILIMPLSISAEELPCSIRPPQDTSDSVFSGLAKVSKADATNAALATINVSSPKGILASVLKIEQSCLVYSFDILISGKPGIEVILVDAGTGKILSRKHECPKQEMTEDVKDKNVFK